MRCRFASSLLPALLLTLIALVRPAGPLAAAGADVVRIARSDAERLDVTLRWDLSGIVAEGDGLRLALPECRLAGEPGAPMLPQYRALIALPRGCDAALDWRLVASRAVSGRPLPFPTREFTEEPGGDPRDRTPRERSIVDPALFAEARPISARLEPERNLRDLRVVELVIDAAAWSPETGLTVATEIEVSVRFVGSARARAASKEPARRPEKLWDAIYANSLLNGAAGRLWRERTPARAFDRSARTAATLRLELETNGVYGVSGADLIAHGIPVGAALAEIALFRRTFDWNASDEPVAGETGHPRLFLDEDGDGLLDAEDTLVFVGRDLASCEGSVDPIQWYSTAGVLWAAVAADLAVPVDEAAGWEDTEPSYPVPDTFPRHQYGGPSQGAGGDKGEFNYLPTEDYYIDENAGPTSETWVRNLYFNDQPPGEGSAYTMTLESPGYAAGTSAELTVFLQGIYSMPNLRNIAFTLSNGNGSFSLPSTTLHASETLIHTQALAADRLVDGESSLAIRASSSDGMGWYSYTKYWELDYASTFQARDDSLFFNAGDLSGPAEIRVGGLTHPADQWLLLRTDEAAPTRIRLDAPENQAGAAGDYELRFRSQLAGGETWWIVDRARLLAPALTDPGSTDCLNDPGPYDVLVISADEFHETMEAWETFRESQGFAVKRLRLSDVWETFSAGSPTAVGIRHAVRFAYQQWGAEALLLVGDCSEDARAWNRYADPNFVPAHCMQVEDGGEDEVVTIEAWVTKFTWNGWPSLVMGRLPVEDVEELENLLAKIECFENYDPDPGAGDCGAGDWRKRFLFIADDCWQFDHNSPPRYYSNEENFTSGQESAADFIRESSVTGDVEVVPFNARVLTHPHYEAGEPWPSAAAWTATASSILMQQFRALLNPVAMDTVAHGYSHVVIQGHGNSKQIAHELMYATNQSVSDPDVLENHGRPFVFSFYGCHGNTFSMFDEGKTSRQDCIGEQFLLADGMKGAVLSYASEGLEYLGENLDLAREFHNLMFWRDDYNDGYGDIEIVPDWRFGTLELMAEFREGDRPTAYRFCLLGDPLTRIDLAPPRIKVWVNRERLPAGSPLPALAPGSPLAIDALVYDEVGVRDVDLTAGSTSLLVDPPVVGWIPGHAEGNTLDSLIANTDTLLTDLIAPLDTLSARTTGRARSWYLHADLTYDPSRETLVISGLDNAERLGTFDLIVPRSARFFDARGDSLVDGQWVDAAGELIVDVMLPEPDLAPDDFRLLVDGEELEREIEIVTSALYRMTAAYDWTPGDHLVSVVRQAAGEEPVTFGGLSLVVDGSARMLDALIFPNPFRDTAFIRYQLTRSVASGTLSLYTLTGRRIYRAELTGLTEGDLHAATWDGRDQGGDKVANGVYIVRMVLRPHTGDEIVWEDRIVRMR